MDVNDKAYPIFKCHLCGVCYIKTEDPMSMSELVTPGNYAIHHCSDKSIGIASLLGVIDKKSILIASDNVITNVDLPFDCFGNGKDKNEEDN